MRIFPINCEVIFTRPDDPWKGKIGVVKSAPSDNGRYLVEVDGITKLRHGNDMCEASQYMKDKAMENKQTVELTDVARGILICRDKGLDLDGTKKYFIGFDVEEELIEQLHDELIDYGINSFVKEYLPNETALIAGTDLTAIVRNTNAIIEIDVDSAISYIDQRVKDYGGEI